MAGVQGVGVVGSQNPLPVGEQLLESDSGAGGVTDLAPPVRQVVASAQRVRVDASQGIHGLG